VAVPIIEPLGVFFCGEKSRELLRPLCFFPQRMLTQAVQYLARLRYCGGMTLRSIKWQAMQDMRAGLHKTPEEVGDRFEALLGAMYADHGLDFASSWFETRLRCVVKLSGLAAATQVLEHYCSKHGLKGPEYMEFRGRSYCDPCSPWPTRTHIYSVSVGAEFKVWSLQSLAHVRTRVHCVCRRRTRGMSKTMKMTCMASCK
jgi:hypothetical protein